MVGSTWLCHRSRHCLHVRWPTRCATNVQLAKRPSTRLDRTTAARRSSSSADHGRRGMACGNRSGPYLDVLYWMLAANSSTQYLLFRRPNYIQICTSIHYRLYTVSRPTKYSAQTHQSTPANCRGRLSAQNPRTVLSRMCMKLGIKTVH